MIRAAVLLSVVAACHPDPPARVGGVLPPDIDADTSACRAGHGSLACLRTGAWMVGIGGIPLPPDPANPRAPAVSPARPVDDDELARGVALLEIACKDPHDDDAAHACVLLGDLARLGTIATPAAADAYYRRGCRALPDPDAGNYAGVACLDIGAGFGDPSALAGFKLSHVVVRRAGEIATNDRRGLFDLVAYRYLGYDVQQAVGKRGSEAAQRIAEPPSSLPGAAAAVACVRARLRGDDAAASDARRALQAAGRVAPRFATASGPCGFLARRPTENKIVVDVATSALACDSTTTDRPQDFTYDYTVKEGYDVFVEESSVVTTSSVPSCTTVIERSQTGTAGWSGYSSGSHTECNGSTIVSSVSRVPAHWEHRTREIKKTATKATIGKKPFVNVVGEAVVRIGTDDPIRVPVALHHENPEVLDCGAGCNPILYTEQETAGLFVDVLDDPAGPVIAQVLADQLARARRAFTEGRELEVTDAYARYLGAGGKPTPETDEWFLARYGTAQPCDPSIRARDLGGSWTIHVQLADSTRDFTATVGLPNAYAYAVRLTDERGADPGPGVLAQRGRRIELSVADWKLVGLVAPDGMSIAGLRTEGGVPWTAMRRAN